MSERTAEAATTVEEDGIRVEKAFTDDEFPVPAMTYELSSTHEEAARVRIVDTIPESFPMDRVGFHPDYESDNWTAYKDHRVEFERVLEPGTRVETVFGIRSDDPDIEGFLGTPIIEHVPAGEEIEDVLGTDGTDAVREVLSGDRATLPGMEQANAPTDPDPTGASPEPRATDAETTAAVTRGTEEAESSEPVPGSTGVDAGTAEAGESETVDSDEEPDIGSSASEEPDTTADDAKATADANEADEAAGAGEPAEISDAGEPAETEVGPEAETGEARDGIASALAAEIRAGDVADDDLDVLRSELDVTVPRSVDVRISRLQSSVADIEAYADALAEFIDNEGTAQEILDELQSRIDEVDGEMAALDDRVDDAAAERSTIADDLDEVEGAVVDVEETVARVERSVADVEAEIGSVREDVDDVEGSVSGVTEEVSELEAEITGLDEAIDDVGDDLETLYEGIDDLDANASETDARVDDVEDRLERFDAEFDDLWDDLAEVDSRLTGIEDGLGGDLGDVESDIAEIHDHLEELEAFRKRLNEAFGP